MNWTPSAFWASNVWEINEAYEGYAVAKGVKKKFDPNHYPDDESRKKLRERLERERGNT